MHYKYKQETKAELLGTSSQAYNYVYVYCKEVCVGGGVGVGGGGGGGGGCRQALPLLACHFKFVPSPFLQEKNPVD